MKKKPMIDVGRAIQELAPSLEMINLAIVHPDQIVTVTNLAQGKETYRDLKERLGEPVADSIVMLMAYATSIVLALGKLREGGVMFTEPSSK